MALHSVSAPPKTGDVHELTRALIFAAATVVLIVVAYALAGIQGTGPSLEIPADPAGLEIPF